MSLPVDATDRVCQLECRKGNVREFVGPVRLILVDPPPREYCKKHWGAAFIQLANMMIGATFLTVFFFTLSFKLTLFSNLHVLLSTVGLVLCVPSGVLMCNELNGASVPLKLVDRIHQHFVLMFVGIVCAVGGGVLAVIEKNLEKMISIHSIAGAAAVAFGLINLTIGPVFYLIRRKAGYENCCRKCCLKLHIIFGIACLIASALCVVIGILEPVFKKWVPLADIVYVLIACCVLYTLVILYWPLNKLLSKEVFPEHN